MIDKKQMADSYRGTEITYSRDAAAKEEARLLKQETLVDHFNPFMYLTADRPEGGWVISFAHFYFK